MPRKRTESATVTSRARPAPKRTIARKSPAAAARKQVSRELRKANQDLDEQLRALRSSQRDLEEARAHYADLFDFAPVTYALLDNVGIVLQINLTGCKLLNVDRRHVIGHPLLSYVVQGDRRELLEHLRRCRGAKSVVESELRLASHGSTSIVCRLFSKQTVYEGRDAFPTVIVDQTEHRVLDEARLIAERRQQHAERAAETAQAESAAKDHFLNIVSHELRTPLTPALFAASRLTSWEGLPEQAKRLAVTIKRNIEFEARLIDDLLDVARINRNRITLRLGTFDAHDAVQEAVGICASTAQAKQVTVSTNLLADAHHVRADRARLRQVFWNLLNNAIKYTDAGGSVVVRSSNAGEGVLRVSIRDTGAGMTRNVLENLFAPFDRQLVTATRDVDEGSRAGLGLGLAICKGIVRAHSGQIWAMSDGPGHGSTFGVEFATASAHEAQGADGSPEAQGYRGATRPLRMLIVEDDADSGEMLVTFLSQYGHHVELATSLAVALGRLHDNWDVILSDIGLPDGSGLDIARRAREMAQPPQRMIAFTGYGSSDDISASHEAGFDDHVVKPLDLDRLLKALDPPQEYQRVSN
jgi:PAS domain S-box-containing protein